MKTNIFLSVALFMLVTFSACKKEEKVEPSFDISNSGIVKLEFEHMVDSNKLVLNSQNYINQNGDDYKVTMFKYYVSNINLIDESGKSSAIPPMYFIIDASDSDKEKAVAFIPEGTYTSLQFILGVDEARNTSGAQTGALDPANGMFWSWNTGYIFMMMEGNSSKAASNNGQLRYHIGGFSGANNTIKLISVNFNGQKLIVRKGKEAEIKLSVNINEMFKNPSTINFADLNKVEMAGANAVLMANNYADMFSFKELKSE